MRAGWLVAELAVRVRVFVYLLLQEVMATVNVNIIYILFVYYCCCRSLLCAYFRFSA